MPNKKYSGRKYSFLFLFTLLCSAGFTAVWAQKPTFRNFQVKDGLPSSEVYQVMQDSKGYLWFSTDAGISRYDGYSFRNFTNQNGLPDNTVFGSFEDSKGRIWFRSFSGKLSYFQNDSIHTIGANARLHSIIQNSILTSMYVDKGDTIWCGIAVGSGYVKIAPPYQEAQLVFVQVHKCNGYILHPDSTGSIWGVITHTSLFLHTRNPDSPYTLFVFNSSRHSDILSGPNKILPTSKYLFTRSRQNIFIGYKEIGITEQGDTAVKHFPLDAISLYEDPNGVLWAGVVRNGIMPFKESPLFNESHHYLKGSSVSSMIIDSEGGYWFTTLENGVYYMASENFLCFGKESMLGNTRIQTILPRDSAHIFAGGSDGSVFSIDEQSVRVFNKLHHSSVNKLGYAGNHKLIVGSDSSYAIDLLHPEQINPITVNGEKISFKSFVYTSTGELWGGNYQNLSHINTQSFEVVKQYKTKSRILSLCTDDGHRILIGSAEGLWTYVNDSLTQAWVNTPLLQVPVEDILAGPEHSLWYATKGNGIVIQSGKRYFQLSVRNGLTSNICRSITSDSKGIIWVGTMAGINKITPLALGNYKIESFTVEDGLASNEIYQVARTGDFLWAASNAGVIYFNANVSSERRNPPPVYITACDVNYRKQDMSEALKLSYNQNQVRIGFVGLAYKRGTGLRYKYRLEGLDSTWSFTDALSIQYSALPPGQYTFKVIALNSSGIESRAPAILHFQIAKPFWLTFWFIGGTALFGFVLVYSIYSRRLKTIKRNMLREDLFTRKISEIELKALRAQMNPHFIFNCIASIQNFILKSDTDSANRYLSKFSRLIRLVLINSTHEYISLEKELETLMLYLDLERMRFQNKFSYEFVSEPGIEASTILIAPLIIQPYVENAIWHGLMHLKERPGKLVIDLRKTGNSLKCSVTDNGIGRKKSMESKQGNKHKSLGMSITKERLENINAIYKSKLSVNFIDLSDEKGNPAGTTVEIFIPLSINFSNHSFS
ncbi:MAG TPA: two-component regulator propeller domain-containing protein [Bacteroidia bacterium]|jgi:ligand-binding sensor domain-containing protein|nr:two-component regulator propeller domain-containing protein [Bacteroidia bacterium]